LAETIPQLEERAKFFSALGNEMRLRILSLLLEGERCVSEIVESVQSSGSTVAHHLRTLEEAGLVIGNRIGRFTYYSVQDIDLIKHCVLEGCRPSGMAKEPG